MSHGVADGYTYYKIFSMLSSKSSIVAMSATRQEIFLEKSKEAMTSADFTSGAYPAVNAISTYLFGKKGKMCAYYIDPQAVERLKTTSKANGQASYVSTNDIVTSYYANVVSPRILYVPYNSRQKVPGISDKDAGNYSEILYLDSSAYSSPSVLSSILEKGMPLENQTGDPLPSVFTAAFESTAIIANWTSYSAYGKILATAC